MAFLRALPRWPGPQDFLEHIYIIPIDFVFIFGSSIFDLYAVEYLSWNVNVFRVYTIYDVTRARGAKLLFKKTPFDTLHCPSFLGVEPRQWCPQKKHIGIFSVFFTYFQFVSVGK